MNPLAEAEKTKMDRIAKRSISICADKNGNAPKTIELLKTGVWRTPNHGDFMITEEDLAEYVTNFDNHIGLPGKGVAGAPVDYKHESWDKAAGWIVKLKVEGDTLIGEVEWTPNGAQMIIDGEFKFFSPEFYPKHRGGWCDPEDYETLIENVFVGGGLTNIPLFKGLSAVKASTAGEKDAVDENIIYIKASEIKETNMDLNAIRTKNQDALTDEEKNFLAENKESLTVEEKTKFGFETAPVADAPVADEPVVAPVAPEPVMASTVDPSVAASIASGESVVVKASVLEEMKKQTDAYAKEKAQAVVTAHIARGAIKADQLDKWTGRLLADATIKDDLEALPSNEALSGEQGSDAKAGTATATQQIQADAKKLMEADPKLSVGDATSNVLASNPELAKEYELETKGGIK